MGQGVRALHALPGVDFNSQQSHGGSQPSVIPSSGVFEDSENVLTYVK